MRNFVVTALAAVTLAGAFVAPATAAETVTVKVDYSDLNLKSVAGKEALEARLAAAVKTACSKPDTRSLKSMQAWQNCKDSASSSAAEQFEKTIEFASL